MYSRDEMEERAKLPGTSPAMIRQLLASEERLRGAQYFMGIAEGQRIFRELKGPLHLVDSPELASLRDQVARLQAELIAKDDAWIADQTGNANEIIRLGDKLERLQARLDAGPSVEQLWIWWEDVSSLESANQISATVNRMEAANGTPDTKGSTE